VSDCVGRVISTARGVGGFLGADQMSRFGSVVLDYGGGRILLGAR
jgi:hypothetical protein